jgi:hypothetical protein
VALIDALKGIVNTLTTPWLFITLASVVFFVALPRPAFWRPRLWLALGVGGTLFLGVSMLDADFLKIVAKADNVPIVAMLFLVGFFVWLSMHQAHANDARAAQGLPPGEASDGEDQKTWVWPDLVYTELLCMVIGMIVLVVWSLALQAPIEEPANPARTPNPSKAPWYFLGLQEMLVYYDPWLAGVVFPSLIIVGLMAIPYIDTNPKGNGYFTFRERRWEILVFLIGFLVLWCVLIVLGTFLRGPNWNFFGPYQFWDVNYLVPLNNINVSEIFWIKWLKTAMPSFWGIRELPGIALIALYMVALPPLLAKTVLRRFYEKMGTIRFLIGVNLLLIMIALPIKMYLRWIFNLKYIVAIPEFSFNI